jgi:hypothetical protein
MQVSKLIHLAKVFALKTGLAYIHDLFLFKFWIRARGQFFKDGRDRTFEAMYADYAYISKA